MKAVNRQSVAEKYLAPEIFYPADENVPVLDGDASLRRADLQQLVVPPSSLLWKYLGDLRFSMGAGQYLVLTEGAWHQIARGGSEHSRMVTATGLARVKGTITRARNTVRLIFGSVYEDPAVAKKLSLQLRNSHKAIKGEMPQGKGQYHALNPESFYWAHVTFFMWTISFADVIVPGGLSREEKAQIFEESKHWWSMYGVDDQGVQPNTWEDFERYCDDVFANKLHSNAFTTFTGRQMFMTQSRRPPRLLPAPIKRYVWPALIASQLITAAALPQRFRDEIGIPWTDEDERDLRQLQRYLHGTDALFKRLPLRLRYIPVAATAFRREGIDPNSIDLRSAQRDLQQVRDAAGAAHT